MPPPVHGVVNNGPDKLWPEGRTLQAPTQSVRRGKIASARYSPLKYSFCLTGKGDWRYQNLPVLFFHLFRKRESLQNLFVTQGKCHFFSQQKFLRACVGEIKALIKLPFFFRWTWKQCLWMKVKWGLSFHLVCLTLQRKEKILNALVSVIHLYHHLGSALKVYLSKSVCLRCLVLRYWGQSS